MLNHKIRLLNEHELKKFFDVKCLKIQPCGNGLDAICFLNPSFDRTFVVDLVDFGRVQTKVSTVIFGLVCIDNILNRNLSVAYKELDQVCCDPFMYGIAKEEFDERDIPLRFLVNGHINGQSKLFCNAMEVATVIAESGLDAVSVGVVGSSSQSINAGGAYHVLGYLLALMNLKESSVSMYDFFETQHSFNIGTTKMSSVTYSCPGFEKFNVVIDDTWTPEKFQWKVDSFKDKIYNVKNFTLYPSYIQPFFEDNVLKENRITSYNWKREYRGVCYFRNHVICYECSYVEELVTRLCRALLLRNPTLIDYVPTLRNVLLSWIFRFKKYSNHFMRHDYHGSMFNIYLHAYRLGSFFCIKELINGLTRTDVALFEKYRAIPKKGFFFNFSPEYLLYSHVQFSSYNRRCYFLSDKGEVSDVDIYLNKYLDSFKVITLSRTHTSPSHFVDGHVALIEVLDDDFSLYHLYQSMVKERSKFIVFMCNRLTDLPCRGFSHQYTYDVDFNPVDPDNAKHFVYWLSHNPVAIYPTLKFENIKGISHEGLRNYFSRFGINFGTRQYYEMLRYLNKVFAMKEFACEKIDDLKYLRSLAERNGCSFDVSSMLLSNGFYKTLDAISQFSCDDLPQPDYSKLIDDY